MKRRTLVFAFALFMALGLAGRVFAQADFGSVSGKVVGTDGFPIPGVEVTATGPKITEGKIVAKTNAEGFYRMPRVEAGTIALEFKVANFKTLRMEQIVVALGSKLEVNATLEIATIANEVSVVAKKPLLDAEKPNYNISVDSQTLTKLPLPHSGDAMSAMSYNAGDAYFGSTLGADWQQNQLVIDGGAQTLPSTGEPYTRGMYDQTEEIEYSYGASPPEYGGFTGSMVRMITKRGTNTFSGYAAFYYTAPWLLASSVQPSSSSTPVNNTYSVGFGGPIIPEKLLFYIGGVYGYTQMQWNYSAPNVFTYNIPEGKVRLTMNWDKDNKTDASFYYRFMGGTDYGVWNPSISPEAYEAMNMYTTDTTLNHTTFFGTNVILDLTASYLWSGYNSPLNPKNVSMVTDLRLPPPNVFNTGGGWGGAQNTNSEGNFNSNAKLTYFVDHMAGSHEFKIGADYLRYYNDQTSRVQGGKNIVIQPDGTYTAYWWNPYSVHNNEQRLAAFIQDSWKLGRLNVVAGLRYDYVNGWIPDQAQPDGSTITGPGNVFSFNEWSPRVAVNYAITEDGKTMFRINWGRYYPAIPVSAFSGLNPAVGATYYAISPDGGQTYDVNAVIQPSLATYDPNIKSFHNDIFSASLERQIFKDATLSVNYMKRWQRDFYGFLPLHTYTAVQTPDTYTGQMITVYRQNGLSQWYFTNIPASYNLFADYDAFQIIFNKRFSDHWLLNISYHYENSRGTADTYFTALNTSTYYPISSAGYRMDPNALVNWNGRMNMSIPHQLRILTSYEFPWNINASAFITLMHGQTWTTQFTAYDAAQGIYGTTVLVEPKGSRTLPDQWRVDFSLSKTFRFGGHFNLEINAQCTNLFNAQTATSIWNDTGGSLATLYGMPSGYMSARAILLGAKISW